MYKHDDLLHRLVQVETGKRCKEEEASSHLHPSFCVRGLTTCLSASSDVLEKVTMPEK